MEIIDAQIHPVAPAVPWSDTFSKEQTLETGAELAIAAMNAVGVDAAVVNWLHTDVLAYVRHAPDRFAGLPLAGPSVPIDGTVDEFISEIAATPGMVGIRVALSHPQDSNRIEQFRAGQFTPFFEAAAREALPVFVLANGHLPELHDTLRRYETLPFIVDHLGLQSPSTRPLPPDLFDDLPQVLALAQFPNVAVKFTGVPALAADPYPFADVWPIAHKVIDAFGVDRLMWGSDFTRCAALHSYREAVEFLHLTDELSEAEKEALFSGTIRRWLRWPTAAPSLPGGAA